MSKKYIWTAYKYCGCCAVCFLSSPKEQRHVSCLPSCCLFTQQGMWGLVGCPQEKCRPVIHGARAERGSQQMVTVCFLFPARQQLHRDPWQQAFGRSPCGTLGVCKSGTALRGAKVHPPGEIEGEQNLPQSSGSHLPSASLCPLHMVDTGGSRGWWERVSFSHKKGVGQFWVIMSMLCTTLLEDYLKWKQGPLYLIFQFQVDERFFKNPFLGNNFKLTEKSWE